MTHVFQSSILRGTYLHITAPLIPTSFVALNSTSMHCHTYWKLTTVVPMVSALEEAGMAMHTHANHTNYCCMSRILRHPYFEGFRYVCNFPPRKILAYLTLHNDSCMMKTLTSGLNIKPHDIS